MRAKTGASARALLKDDPDVDTLEHLCRPRRDPLLPAAQRPAANDFFSQVVIVAKDVAARDAAAGEAREGAGRAVAERRRARLAARARAARRLAGAVSRERAGQSTQVREIALELAPDRRRRPARAARQFRLDGARAAGPGPHRPGPGAPARRELAARSPQVLNAVVTGSTVTQVRDDIYLVNVVARATDEQRVSFRPCARCKCLLPSGRTVPLSQFATFEFDQEYPLVWRRDRVPTLTVRADVDARRAARRRRWPRSRRRSTSSTRSCRSPTSIATGGTVRGERRIAGVGVRRRAAHAAADARSS